MCIRDRLNSCRSLAIRTLDGSAACVGVPLKKSAAQLPISPEKVVTTVFVPWLAQRQVGAPCTPPDPACGPGAVCSQKSSLTCVSLGCVRWVNGLFTILGS